MADHTPGLWIAEDTRVQTHSPNSSYNSRLIAYTGSPKPIGNLGWAREGEANAQLIAAAPELLEALENLLEECYDETSEGILFACLAIAKARGEI